MTNNYLYKNKLEDTQCVDVTNVVVDVVVR